MSAMDELTNGQRALYWLTLAEASNIDEQMMLVPMLAKQIRGTIVDVIEVREALLSGHSGEAGLSVPRHRSSPAGSAHPVEPT
jgi:hypothetical protein